MQSSVWVVFASGLLFGAGSGLLYLFNGRTAGFSGVLRGVLMPWQGGFEWKAFFIAGALLAGAVGTTVIPGARIASYGMPLTFVLLAGFLVGFGSRMGNGCTSGHGVCGVASLSKRSHVATATFVFTGMVAVAMTKLILGGV